MKQKIMLVSLYDRGALGIRALSGFLKSKGYETYLVYFKQNKPRFKRNSNRKGHLQADPMGDDYILNYAEKPSNKEISLLASLVKKIKPLIVGFSVTTIARGTAATLTKAIQPIMEQNNGAAAWGGIDVTTCPEEAIKYSKIICIGEGYSPLLNLAKNLESKKPITKINGLWVREGEKITKNPPAKIVENLDELPFPDFSPKNKFFINNDKMRVNDASINNDPGIYTIMTSMGCPFACSYCCNSFLRDLCKGQKYLRRRSVDSVIKELKIAKKEHEIRYIDFYDEVFTFDKKWVKEFAEKYKREIGIPFWCNVSPFFVDRDILIILKDCGLDSVTMGIQSGSERILYDFYERRTPVKEIEKCAKILHDLKIMVFYDIITNNPFETEDDCRKTFELLLRLPQRKKFMIGISKLSLFPNTKILEKGDYGKKYDEKMFDFWNKMYLLTQSYLPKRVLMRLSHSRFYRQNPELLKIFFLASPTSLFLKFVLIVRDILPADTFNYIKSVKYKLVGK